MSFIDFLYGTTDLKLGFVICAMVVGGTIVTQIVVDRLWAKELRHDHNDIAGFLIAVVGVIFAILMSSLTVIVLARQDRAQTLVLQEAQSLEAIDREIDLLPANKRQDVRHRMLAYLDDVIDGDWSEMRGGKWPRAADKTSRGLWSEIGALPVRDSSEMLVTQGLRQQFDKLAEIRRSRSEIATTGVDRVVWSVVLLGSASTIVFAILFGVRNFLAHVLMTGLLSFMIALAISMIVAIDWPYFGDDSVGPEPLREVRATLQAKTTAP